MGEWEGVGKSDAGHGKAEVKIELTLNGQFRFHTGVAEITEMTPEQIQYLKQNLHASNEEIERFRKLPFASLEIYTIDLRTGQTIGYLFDSLRCIAEGRGTCDGKKEITEWEWATGHKSTRIMERVDNDTVVATERILMPDGSYMEESGKTTRKKATIGICR
ncbi:MAG: hypothetical protein L0Y36_06130 [Planctomycetales bacterium]|nr:hypothetical protein [Planctomycetales bacterium]